MSKRKKPLKPPAYMTMEEVQERLQCGRSKIYELLKYGRLQRIRTGRRMRILADSVDAFENALVKESHNDAKAAQSAATR